MTIISYSNNFFIFINISDCPLKIIDAPYEEDFIKASASEVFILSFSISIIFVCKHQPPPIGGIIPIF